MSLFRLGTSLFALKGAFVGVGTGVSAPTGPVYAKTFSVDISPTSSAIGATIIITVSPVGGVWPSNQAVVGTYSGSGASFTSTSVVAGTSTSVSFTGTVGAAGSGMINATMAALTSTGGKTYTANAAGTPITPSTPTGAGNRFDLVLDRSVAALGDTVTGLAIINGLWPSASGQTITLSNGVTINLPNSGSAPAPFSFVLTAPMAATAEMSIVATNSAGFYNPYPAPLTVFSASAGSAQSLTGSLANYDMMTWQRDVANGNPSGFAASWAKGWGEVGFNFVQPGPALFVRLHDAMSNGATATQGTGTALTGIVQVHGAFSAGSVRALLPAGPYIYYVDVATDAAFTNPVRIAQRFRVGVVVATLTRSYECGIARSFDDDSTSFPNIYTKVALWVTGDSRYDLNTYNGGYWFLSDGNSTNAAAGGEHTSSGTQEFGRLLEGQLGVCVGITGLAAAGGGFDGQVAHDGTFCNGFRGTVAASCNGKFRYLYVACSDWDGNDGNGNASVPLVQTLDENRIRYNAGIDYIARRYPACAVQGWCVGNSGWGTGDGSSQVTSDYNGRARNQAIIMQEIEPINPMVISKDSTLWNEFRLNHATMASRLDYVRPSFRALMAAEVTVMGGLQTLERGPVLGSGVLDKVARTITMDVHLAAGANLLTIGASYSNPNIAYNTASAGELATLFGVYLTGQMAYAGKPVAISGATIVNNKVVLQLSGTTGITYSDGTTDAMPNGFWVSYGADYWASNRTIPPGGPSRGVSLTDDRQGSGIPYGWLMRQAIDRVVS